MSMEGKSPKESVEAKQSFLPDGMSKSKAVLLVGSLVIAYICWGCAMSLQAPLFPTEAEKKGATASEVTVKGLQYRADRKFVHEI